MKDKNKMPVINNGWNYTAITLGWILIVFTFAAIAYGLLYSAQRSWYGGWQYASDQQSISNRLSNVATSNEIDILNSKLDADGRTLDLVSNIVILLKKADDDKDERLKVLEQDDKLGMSLSNLFIPITNNIVLCSNYISVIQLNEP